MDVYFELFAFWHRKLNPYISGFLESEKNISTWNKPFRFISFIHILTGVILGIFILVLTQSISTNLGVFKVSLNLISFDFRALG